jgi:hypothetical protein
VLSAKGGQQLKHKSSKAKKHGAKVGFNSYSSRFIVLAAFKTMVDFEFNHEERILPSFS